MPKKHKTPQKQFTVGDQAKMKLHSGEVVDATVRVVLEEGSNIAQVEITVTASFSQFLRSRRKDCNHHADTEDPNVQGRVEEKGPNQVRMEAWRIS